MLDAAAARRLALARGGLLAPRWTGLPERAAGAGKRARDAAHAVIGRFGYLQLDTVSVAGARSHGLVLLSRIEGMHGALAENLLVPGAPLFEYWGHEASWMPLDLYPLFGWRRKAYRRHPWFGDVIGGNREMAAEILRRAREEGPFRSSDLEGERSGPWFGHKESRKVAEALWSAGDLAIRERRGFLKVYDLAERVIPAELRAREVGEEEAVRALVLRSLDGHGWAETGTLAATFRLRTTRPSFKAALRDLAGAGEILPCRLRETGGAVRAGWIRPRDLEAADALRRWRPRGDGRGVLLSPFDPLLWDRKRARLLFGFDQVLEIYVPKEKRRFGYFAMPVLLGERLVARADVKSDRKARRVRALAVHYEEARPSAAAREAVRTALARLETGTFLTN